MATPTDVARLLVVRHGRTAWNAEDRAPGPADTSLDASLRVSYLQMASGLAARKAHADQLAAWADENNIPFLTIAVPTTEPTAIFG